MEQTSETGKLAFPLALAAHISLFPGAPRPNLAGNPTCTQTSVSVASQRSGDSGSLNLQ